ncbi:MAG: amidohydrolase [Deltaproteobacteria bacterium]|nr:MAG: amidohydrolase [Deltaproteobacteria bacterium]
MKTDRAAAATAGLNPAAPPAIDREVERLAPRLIALRRHLHAHPEPSGQELATTAYLARLLREEGLEVRVAPAGRGLSAEPAATRRGRRVAIRADIDALRLHDAKDVPYRSLADGVCHACGHDAHTAAAVGAALALEAAAGRAGDAVPWRLILQPAEESSEGAREMIEAGAMDGVGAIIALHVDPERLLGHAAFRTGMLTAYCDEIDVTVTGSGGHAARPHHAVDPIAAAAELVSAIYQFVPRAVDSRDPVVVTFGSIHGGSTQNVIPEQVHLRGTARTHSHAATSRVEQRILEIASGIAGATGARIEVEFKRGPDAVVNDAAVTDCCRRAAADVLGADNIEDIPAASMGGEDFADYLAHAPGCLMRLGVGRPDGSTEMLHSPRFDLDESAIGIGARILARAAWRLTQPVEACDS